MPKLVISGPAEAVEALKPEAKPITDPAKLKEVHGIFSDDLCADSLDEAGLGHLGVTGGRLRFTFDGDLGKLCITTAYVSPRQLSEEETQMLVEFTTAHWSDGLGSGAFGNHRKQILSKSLALALHHGGAPRESLGDIFVNAFPDSGREIQVNWSDSGDFDDELIADLICDADAGDESAIVELGLRHMSGVGVEADPLRAVQWFKLGADKGYPLATTYLGRCYLKGSGIEVNVAEAIKCFERAAAVNNTMAIGCLGDCYHKGLGVEQNPQKGFAHYARGAELGDVICLREVGEGYELGKGVEQDLQQALSCYEQCVEAGLQEVESRVARVQELLEGASLLNAYCTCREIPPLDFPHKLNFSRHRSDPKMDDHLDGFIGFVLKGGQREMTKVLYHVIRHIQKVQHHVSLIVETAHLDNFRQWAARANAISFHRDGSIRNPDGRIIVDPETGEGEENADVPFPEGARLRKEKTNKKLVVAGIEHSDTLPPVVGDGEVELRPAADVLGRAQALFVVALRAESLATNDEISRDELKKKFPRAFEHISPREQEFLHNPEPDSQEVIDFAWRYEALYVLQWALGLVDALPFPDKICDVPLVAQTAIESMSCAPAKASLRPVAEILDCLDLHFRLHWACREAAFDGGEVPKGLDVGVINERHYALNWLTRFEGADWDKVDTPT